MGMGEASSSSLSSSPPPSSSSAFIQQPARRRIINIRRRPPIPGSFHPDNSFGSSDGDESLISGSSAGKRLATSPPTGEEGAPDLDHAILPRSGSGSTLSGLPASRKRTWQPSRTYSSMADAVASPLGTSHEYSTMRGDEAVHAQTLLRAQQERDELQQQQAAQQQPAAKRRRGLAGTIVDGALSGLLYGGAAALTAYSLWSTWGAKPSKESTPTPESEMLGGDKDKDDDALPSSSSSVMHQAPPPPYEGPSNPPQSAFVVTASPAAARTPRRSAATRNVYVSGNRNRRRRPVFHSSRSSSSNVARPSTPQQQQQEADADPEGDASSDDETYLRFQQQMATLIAQGQAALQSTPTLADGDYVDDDVRMRTGTTTGTTSRRSVSPTKALLPRTPTKSRIPQLAASSSGRASPAAGFRGVDDLNLNFSNGDDGGAALPPTPASTMPTSTSFRNSPLAQSSGLPTLASREPYTNTIRPSGSRPFVFGASEPAPATDEMALGYEVPVRRGGGGGGSTSRGSSKYANPAFVATPPSNSPYTRRAPPPSPHRR